MQQKKVNFLIFLDVKKNQNLWKVLVTHLLNFNLGKIHQIHNLLNSLLQQTVNFLEIQLQRTNLSNLIFDKPQIISVNEAVLQSSPVLHFAFVRWHSLKAFSLSWLLLWYPAPILDSFSYRQCNFTQLLRMIRTWTFKIGVIIICFQTSRAQQLRN